MRGHVCPHCGYDLEAAEPVILGDWSCAGPGLMPRYKRQVVYLTKSEREVFWTIMRAHPRAASTEIILNRLGSDGTHNVVAVMLSRIRRRIRALGIPDPILNVRGYGYEWIVEDA